MKKTEEFRGIIDEIQLLIKYAVSKEESQQAVALVEKYKGNGVALSLLKEFYSFLPEAREEAVSRVVQIDMRQGIFLLGVDTGTHEYIFFATEEDAGSLGEYLEEAGDEETFRFFGYSDKQEFLKLHPTMEEFKDFEAILPLNKTFCPVCSAAVGEHHHLGCPVEICPWCLGQLSKCNCRFDQLEKEVMNDDEDLERLELLLQEKGRIPFEAGQGPSYPMAGKSTK